MSTEQTLTGLAVVSFLAGVARWLIGAWNKDIHNQIDSPSSTSVIIDASIDVVDILRKQLISMSHELDRLQIEVSNVRNLLAQVEQQRDEWRSRAIALGWIDPPKP